MAASAIGGGLLAITQRPAAAGTALTGQAPSVLANAPPLSGAVAEHLAASSPGLRVAADAHGASWVAPAHTTQPAQPAPAGLAASATAASMAEATARPDEAPISTSPTGAASVGTNEPLRPAADTTFGLDVNGDGVPDSLERFVRKTIVTPATRVAARRYYRVALPLARVAEQGEALTAGDQKAVFRAAECYLLSAAEDGLAEPPNLNDRASLTSAAAARRVQALAEALRGIDYRVAGGKRQACG